MPNANMGRSNTIGPTGLNNFQCSGSLSQMLRHLRQGSMNKWLFCAENANSPNRRLRLFGLAAVLLSLLTGLPAFGAAWQMPAQYSPTREGQASEDITVAERLHQEVMRLYNSGRYEEALLLSNVVSLS